MNDLFQISLYKQGSTYLFDDEFRNIKAEPFVMGASELILIHLRKKGLSRRKKNIVIQFSLTELDNYDILLACTEKCFPLKVSKLKKRFGKYYSNHVHNIEYDYTSKPTSAYYTDQEGNECWLCPAQLKFFSEVANKIYVKIIG